MPPVSIQKKYHYRGCYNDNVNNTRILPASIGLSNVFGLEALNQCYQYALSIPGNTFFGLQFGGQCFYGSNDNPATKLVNQVAESQCSMDCMQTQDNDLASNQVKCGAFNRMNIYRKFKLSQP